MSWKILRACVLALLGLGSIVSAQQPGDEMPLLSVREIMNGVITPATSTIWGAYQLQTEAEWQDVANAALAVIAAGDLLRKGGAAEGEMASAAETQWQQFNADMLAAARLVIEAVEQQDEEALFAAGNDALYPPCEACHQRYQSR